MHVALFRDLAEPTVAELQREFPGCNFTVVVASDHRAELLARAQIVLGNPPPELLRSAPALRWLQLISSGFDDYTFLANSGVTVTTAHGIHAPVIANHVLMTFLIFVRRQLHFARCQTNRVWDRRPALLQNTDGMTVGLLGCGTVGQAIASRLQPLGVRVLAVNRHGGNPPEFVERLLPLRDVDEILPHCDHVVLTLPLTNETRHVLDARRLDLLKPDAVVHNVGRGGLIDEAALISRLESGRLGGAALDVFEQEPPPQESPLWTHPQVIVTPHLAGHHRDLGRLILDRFRSNLRRYLDGQPLQAEANFARGY